MKKDLEEILQRIELEANDEISLLSDLGPEFFPMQDLIQMKYKLEKKQLEYKIQYKKILILAIATIILLISGSLCAYIDFAELAVLLFMLCPVVLGTAVYLFIILKKDFGNKSDFESRIDIIDNEIIVRNYTRRKQV